jgi:ubiquinone/menaquinone biosynthesis C-methylase UbiE
MVQSRAAADHGKEFVDYYERASASARTTLRFSRIRDCALHMLTQQGGRTGPFDVADIGCGAGTQAMLWAELGHRVAAIDASASLVGIGAKRAQESGRNVRFAVGWAQTLPFDREQFDVVLMPELLEHVSEWEACLEEAVRVLRPGGLLYVSTTNKLCPIQQEFNLPGYSWYPPAVKRWCVAQALGQRPEWANYTRYPAVNWFSYFGLQQWLELRGMETFDRFDILARQDLKTASKWLVSAVRRFVPLRFLAQVATEGTTVWGLKRHSLTAPLLQGL